MLGTLYVMAEFVDIAVVLLTLSAAEDLVVKNKKRRWGEKR